MEFKTTAQVVGEFLVGKMNFYTWLTKHSERHQSWKTYISRAWSYCTRFIALSRKLEALWRCISMRSN